jgi:hypothetical protein
MVLVGAPPGGGAPCRGQDLGCWQQLAAPGLLAHPGMQGAAAGAMASSGVARWGPSVEFLGGHHE